jgi:hypothetical protein
VADRAPRVGQCLQIQSTWTKNRPRCKLSRGRFLQFKLTRSRPFVKLDSLPMEVSEHQPVFPFPIPSSRRKFAVVALVVAFTYAKGTIPPRLRSLLAIRNPPCSCGVYCLSKTNTFGSLLSGTWMVIVKVFLSAEMLISCVSTTFPPTLSVSAIVLSSRLCADDTIVLPEPVFG